MATLTVQDADLDGLLWTGASVFVACAAGGDQFLNDGRTWIHLKNTNAATRTVTINSQRNCDQGFDHDQAVIVGATTGEAVIGPFPTARFSDTLGFVLLTYSAVTNLTIAVFSL
jgi:hypothetical protein